MIGQVTLALADYAIIVGITSVPTTMLIVNLKMLAARFTMLENRVQRLEDEKLNRVDFLRSEVSGKLKLDRMAEAIAAIDAKLDMEFGIATAVNRLAGVIAEKKQNE